MTTDDRPSIAELKLLHASAEPWPQDGMIAILRASPVLLEIAAAALARKAASSAAAKSRNKWRMSGHHGPAWEQLERDDKVLSEASAAYDAALAKVRP